MKVADRGRRMMLGAVAAVATVGWIAGAGAQNRAFSFAYDQPNTTAYGIAANIFEIGRASCRERVYVLV